MATKELDVVEDAILQAYQTNKRSRSRVQIQLDQFGKLAMLKIIIGNVKKPDEFKVRLRFFRDNVEVFSYWFKQNERTPIIKKMLFEGYTQKRISEMLGVSASTINKDVTYMREHTVMLDGFEFKGKPINNTRFRRKYGQEGATAIH